MSREFIITAIERVILVDKYEYKEKVTTFKNDLYYNEFVFFLSGKSIVKFNGKTLIDSENTIRFMPKCKVFEYSVDRQEIGDCIVVNFSTDCDIADEAYIIKPARSDAMRALFKKIFSVWVAKNEGYYFECVSLLYKIISELQKESYIPENQYNAIKPAIEYIEEHFLEKNIPMEYLIELSTVSYSYLRKLFVKKFGLSPKKYIIHLKINYACELLKCKSYTITQVAEICGFLDVYYFSGQFKKIMGISPSEFIKKYKSCK